MLCGAFFGHRFRNFGNDQKVFIFNEPIFF